jgi:hypothetical protein
MEETRALRLTDALRDRGIDAHRARADYDEPEGHERPAAPLPEPALPREGGVFRRFLGGFREP